LPGIDGSVVTADAHHGWLAGANNVGAGKHFEPAAQRAGAILEAREPAEVAGGMFEPAFAEPALVEVEEVVEPACLAERQVTVAPAHLPARLGYRRVGVQEEGGGAGHP